MGTNLTPFLFIFLFTHVNTQHYHETPSICPPNFSGSLQGNSCSREYSICVNGVHQSASCDEDSVFYQNQCIPAAQSPECAISNDDSKSSNFDCSSRQDGSYAIGCSNEFVQCVSGSPYTVFCPSTLVFVEKYQKCLESCDSVYEGAVEEDLDGSGEVYTSSRDNDESSNQEFNCAGLKDGNYPQGCSPFFFVCVGGNAFISYCPAGLVYNENQQACDYACTSPTTTTPTIEPTSTVEDDSYLSTNSVSPTTEDPTTNPSNYEEATTEEVTTYAPSFDDEETTTEEVSTYAPSFDDEETTTVLTYVEETTTPGVDDEVTTSVPIQTTTEVRVCEEGKVTTFGVCASRFSKCVNNFVRAKQCPTSTLFEAPLLLCVYDLPQCQPTPIRPISNYLKPDIVVSPFDDSEAQLQNYGRRGRHWRPLIEDPFFTPSETGHRHHKYGPKPYERKKYRFVPGIDSPFSTSFRGRAFLNDKFRDHRRPNMDKIYYRNSKKGGLRRIFYLDDEFDKPHPRTFASDIRRVFPSSDTRRSPVYPVYTATSYPSAYGSRKKRYAPYGNPTYNHGNSVRQNQVNEYCRNYTTPVFLSFEQCFDRFVYCSGNGVNRMAACPVGEHFDRQIGSCSETCGTSASPAVPINSGIGNQQSNDFGGEVVNSGNFQSTNSNNKGSSDNTQFFNDNNQETIENSTPSSDSQSTNDDSATRPTPSSDLAKPLMIVKTICEKSSNGLFSLGCSQEYIHCHNGVPARKTCPAALYFDESRALCDYRDSVEECKASDSNQDAYAPTMTPYKPTTVPPTPSGPSSAADDSQSSFYQSTTVSPGQDVPSTYTPFVKPYKPLRPTQDSIYQSPVAREQDPCNRLVDGAHGEGCSASFIMCEKGQLMKTVTCPLGEGYDPSVQMCKSFSLISTHACGTQTSTGPGLAQPLPYIRLDSVTSTTTTESSVQSSPYKNNNDAEENRSDYQNVSQYGNDSDEDSNDSTESSIYSTSGYESSTYTDEEDNLNEDIGTTSSPKVVCKAGSRASVGFCSASYLECDVAKNTYVVKACADGESFDVHSSQCVASEKCGHEAIRQIVNDVVSTGPLYKQLDRRCANSAENETRSTGSCRNSYIRCSNGKTVTELCSGGMIFSNAHKKCVERSTLMECAIASAKPVSSYYNRPSSDAFCDGKPDGLFRNPGDCSGILQCFGGDLFEYPSCPARLAFNEVTGKCDYPQNVRGCDTKNNDEGECSEHGAFLSDDDNCSIFYRCVWGRKVEMKCPLGTLFNPALSVCDWPSAVPQCAGSEERLDADDEPSSYESYY
ncbi:unnamed protein product [Caenorhabditis bovis]|uniref:Chitin-binding type-2 domain-containing protein n=1 Tax=Caenorhabditis bovis TaxID=2654633 RepID=A0A8S1E8N3_9PELO|nr:unnamed protein product [Caenorhabditis bovis]